MHEITKLSATGLLAYCLHYGSAHFYTSMCTPAGIPGFFAGLVSVASPVCGAALATVAQTQNLYSNFVVFAISRLFVEAVDPKVRR